MVLVTAIFLVTMAGAASGVTSIDKTGVVRPSAETRLEVRLLDLSVVRSLINTLAREAPAMTEGARAAAWADFSLVSQAVLGVAEVGPFDSDDLVRATTSGEGPRVPATQGVNLRDAAAYQLLALGYSARETADVISGRISRRSLDIARQMLAVGLTREAAANYLDSEYRRVTASREARNAPPPARQDATVRTTFDALIEKYASLHGVEVALVRAIIQTESAFNPQALSRKGAIGLMQLMPMTARELGVDPMVPEQNIEGGIRYLSQLLKMFGGTELALVAYNGGPGYAQRYARGEVPLYGETRDYVKRVVGRINAYQ